MAELEGAHDVSGQNTDQVSTQTLVEFMSTGQVSGQFSLLLTILDTSLLSSTGIMATITKNQFPVQCREPRVIAAA